MAKSPEREARVRFVEWTPEQAAAAATFTGTGNGSGECIGVMGVFLPKGAGPAERAAAMRQLREECELRGMLMRIDQNVAGIRRDVRELHGAKRPAAQPVSESEARRVFRLLQGLESDPKKQKAQLDRVFRLTVLEKRSQKETAEICECVRSLISRRVATIECEFERSIEELRLLASAVLDLESSVKGQRWAKKKEGAAPAGAGTYENWEENDAGEV